MTLEQITRALATAADLARAAQMMAGAAGVTLTERQSAAVGLATTSLDVLHDALVQERDIDSMSWAMLDAEEVRILAADQAAQEAAVRREAAAG